MGFVSDAKDSIGDAFCVLFDTEEKLRRYGINLSPIGPGAGLVIPESSREEFTRNARAIFCDAPPGLPFVPSAPLGQCSGPYNIYIAASALFDGQLQTGDSSLQLRGPIGTPFLEPVAQGVGFVVRIPFVNGQIQDAFSINNNNASGYTDAKITAFTLSRDNGLPDDCGVIPPILPLPDGDRTSPIEINNDFGDIIFDFPEIDINGNLIVPFDLEVGPIEFSGELVLNKGDINLNFGGQPTTPCPSIEPVADEPPPNADDDDPEDDKPANIIGVIIVSSPSANISATEISIPVGPNIFVPRCATVAFKIRIGDAAHWTADIPVKNKNTFIPCPGVIPAIDAYVQPEPGWVTTLTAVRGIVPANEVVLV